MFPYFQSKVAKVLKESQVKVSDGPGAVPSLSQSQPGPEDGADQPHRGPPSGGGIPLRSLQGRF